MSVLIKGMEMPKSCSDCKLRMAVGCCGNLPHNTRMPNCPLVEIPPHGRLIDADKLKEEFPHDEDWDYPVNTNSYVVEAIDKSPTIIPAEEGE